MITLLVIVSNFLASALQLNDYQEYIKLYFMWLDFNQLQFVACHSHVCFKGELP